MANYEVFSLRGYVCDRYTDRGMRGAVVMGERFGKRLNAPVAAVGEVGAAADLGWQECLTTAAPYLEHVSMAIEQTVASGKIPVIAANRCGVSLATMGGALAHRQDAVLVWFDAHGDYHTPATTETGYLGGMVIAGLCGLWDTGYGAPLKPDRVVLAGCRDLDSGEQMALLRDRVPVFLGIEDNLDIDALVAAIAGRPVWLHIDCDVIDPTRVSTEYRVPKGLSFDTLHSAVRAIVANSELVALEVTEFDVSDTDHATASHLNAVMSVLEPAFAKLDKPSPA